MQGLNVQRFRETWCSIFCWHPSATPHPGGQKSPYSPHPSHFTKQVLRRARVLGLGTSQAWAVSFTPITSTLRNDPRSLLDTRSTTQHVHFSEVQGEQHLYMAVFKWQKCHAPSSIKFCQRTKKIYRLIRGRRINFQCLYTPHVRHWCHCLDTNKAPHTQYGSLIINVTCWI
jgi:hypothetical protein